MKLLESSIYTPIWNDRSHEQKEQRTAAYSAGRGINANSVAKYCDRQVAEIEMY